MLWCSSSRCKKEGCNDMVNLMFYTPESSVWCLHDKPFRFGINIRYSTRLSLNYSQSHIILFLFHKNKSRSSSWNRKSCVSYFTHPRQWPVLSICCWFDIHLIHCGHCCLFVKNQDSDFFTWYMFSDYIVIWIYWSPWCLCIIVIVFFS